MINLVIALKCEAKPLIRHLGFKSPFVAHPFPVYQNEMTRLIVSGPGKTAAFNAVAALYEISGRKANEAWLNIGIAGHATLAIGTGVLAHKIKDRTGQKSWYPPIVCDGLPKTAPVLTVDHIEEKFDGEWAYEMEAAGFISAALRFSTAELIHCYKVISDNRISPADDISASRVETLIEQHLGPIDQVIKKIDALFGQLNAIQKEPRELARFLREWHFTFSEQVQLKKLLRRWQALTPQENIWRGELLQLDSANEVIRWLQTQLDEKPVLL